MLKHVPYLTFFLIIATFGSCAFAEPHADKDKDFLARLSEGQRVQKSDLLDRLSDAVSVYKKLISAPDAQLPENLLKKAKCVVIVPTLVKAAFIVGGRHGKGVASCRNQDGKWSPPSFMQISGGSVGWQIGAQSSELVLFMMGETARKGLLKNNFTLGADASVAAGPLGRTAGGASDLDLTGIYAYARSQGLFAGIALEGAGLTPDETANKRYYGQNASHYDILVNGKADNITAEARKLIDILPGR